MAEELYGIVSTLDDERQDAVWRLWADIERQFSVSIRDTHVPHFTYHCAKAYAETLREKLYRIAAGTSPIATGCFFLGIYNAPPPLFFLPLVRTDALSSLHRRLWAELDAISTGAMDRYAAEAWMATVNVTPDIERDISGELLPYLLARDFQWKIRIDNICLLHDTGERQVLEARFDLRG